MGHLSIAGSKMSKSLKNFQTIQDALKTDYTPRGMRVVFLMGRWNDGVEISPDMRTMAVVWEANVNVRTPDEDKITRLIKPRTFSSMQSHISQKRTEDRAVKTSSPSPLMEMGRNSEQLWRVHKQKCKAL
jgi:cysteinyl-tRNA synthetase